MHESPIKLVGRIMDLPTTAPAQVAFAIPKRYMKLAVHRNRMRRLMREAYRLHKGTYHARLSEAGTLENLYRVQLANRTERPLRLRLEARGLPGLTVGIDSLLGL